MATTEKPIALQSELDKAASSFEGFLAPEEENVEPEEVEVEVAGADVVSSVKTMLELLSYGLHADDDVIHRNPISKWLRMRTDDGINKDNALDILQQIDDFLRAEG